MERGGARPPGLRARGLARSGLWALRLAGCLACASSPRPRAAPPSPYPSVAAPTGGYGAPAPYPGPPAQYGGPAAPGANVPPPAGIPPAGYPSPGYPSPGYHPSMGHPPASPAPAGPPRVAPSYPPPAAPSEPPASDPLERLDIGWMRQRSQALLQQLVAALPAASAARVTGIPLAFDEEPGEVNAYASCRGQVSGLGITDGLLVAVAMLARSQARDELDGSKNVEAYIAAVRASPASDDGKLVPAAFARGLRAADARVLARQLASFDEQVAFVLGHELAHHHLGHLPCTGNAGLGGSANAIRLLSHEIPVFNQPSELAADVAGVDNVLTAGSRGPAWSERGALLTMRFFAGLSGGPLFSFQRSHPPASLRSPSIAQAANVWRATGGRGLPTFRLGG